MEKFGRSQPVKRVEDVRFLTGQGAYVDDIAPADALHAVFVRSQVGHGRLTGIDVAEARGRPGVVAVITGAEMAAAGVVMEMAGARVTNSDGTKGAETIRPILALDLVRFVGEPVAVVLADTLAQARDAAELVELQIDDLPVHMDVAPGGETLHDAAPDNLAFDFALGDAEAVARAIDAAAHVVTVEVPDNRVIVNAMEPRGTFAEWDGTRLHVAINGQGVWVPKANMVKHLNLSEDRVRVTNPDTGGGFGMKAMAYPEPYVCAHAAMTLGRSVRWMSDRTEAMLTDTGGRDLTTTATLAFDADHRMVAYRLETVCNLGAYNSQFAQNIQTELFSKVLMGSYAVQAAYMRTRGIYTNTAPVDAYRGAGRPEAIFVLERTVDEAARRLGVDPWELRRCNFIRPDQFPYTTATGVTYDVGEFAALLSTAQTRADHAGFADRRAASARKGLLRGQGICYYIESILGDPSETSDVIFTADGGVEILVGTQSNGQGHETVYARFLADHTGIPAERITVVQGDSDRIERGGGTGGSRSVTVQNTAILATVETMIPAFAAYLAEREGIAAARIDFDDERFRIPGSNLSPTVLDVAEMARADGRADLLRHTRRITLEARSFPNGCHVAEVEIDPQTGETRVDRYTVVDDFGTLINPMLVEGQIHGGVAQGLGQALMERCVYDADGQLLTASFMDYAVPRAEAMPHIDVTTRPVPSLYNPMGMKGCGEAGTVGALAAVTNAVLDALWETGARDVAMPFTPHRVWGWLQDAKAHDAA